MTGNMNLEPRFLSPVAGKNFLKVVYYIIINMHSYITHIVRLLFAQQLKIGC